MHWIGSLEYWKCTQLYQMSAHTFCGYNSIIKSSFDKLLPLSVEYVYKHNSSMLIEYGTFYSKANLYIEKGVFILKIIKITWLK